MGAEDTLDERGAQFVSYGVLGVRGGSDEELVLDIDEVLGVLDGIQVSVCDGVFGFVTRGPGARAALCCQ